MCTLSIIPLTGGPRGYRLVINRDELRTRLPARRPAVFDGPGGVRAAYPIDADAGGTWVAVNDRGLALALLNGNPRPMPALPEAVQRVSRGLIIPALVDAHGPGAALERLGGLALGRFAPFRVVAADESTIADAVWNGSALAVSERGAAPLCFVSSGLGDGLVRPRLDLFDAMVGRGSPTPGVQDSFHRHRWADRPEISVVMDRSDARTTSVTTIDVRIGAPITLRYEDDGGSTVLTLAGATAFTA